MSLPPKHLLCIKDYYDRSGNLALQAGHVYPFTEHKRSGHTYHFNRGDWHYPVSVRTPSGAVELEPETAGLVASRTCELKDILRLHYHTGELQIVPEGAGDHAIVSEHGKITLHPWDHPMDSAEDLRLFCVSVMLHVLPACADVFEVPPESSEELEEELALLHDIQGFPLSEQEIPVVTDAVRSMEEAAAKAKIKEAGLDVREEFHQFLVHYTEDHFRATEEQEEEDDEIDR